MFLSFHKTRVAPTPSGYLHTGNALNFLLTAALAKRSGASLLLRIDDFDQARCRRVYTEDIFETLRFLNIDWDEGPGGITDFEERWSQQYRLRLYNDVLKKLRDTNLVFACGCSRTQSDKCTCQHKKLSLDTPDTNWRLLTDNTPVSMRTLDGSATASLPPAMNNFIVRKKDGFPSYQLTSVADDLHFGVDLIVRGADLWPSTLAQLVLTKALGEDRFASIAFYHHPVLKNACGEKLSKSAGATSVKHWREQGKTLADFYNYLGTLVEQEHDGGLPGNTCTEVI